jgi:hypothetical protein
MASYRHTQRGTLTTCITTLAGIVAAVALYSDGHGFQKPDYLILGLIALVGICFSSLTVVISGGELKMRFGPGWISKRIQVHDIDTVAPVRNAWYHGWGIRKIRRGWLFNVSGTGAVELKMKNGKRYRIGTDVPQELAREIEKVISGRV